MDYDGSFQDVGASPFGGEPEHPDEEACAEPLSAAALGVELPLGEWRPLGFTEGSVVRFQRVAFLDAVRRLEARVLLEGEGLTFGALGSFSVAAVTSDLNSRASSFEEAVTERWCALAAGGEHPEFMVTWRGGGEARGELRYQVAISEEADYDAPLRLLHSKMQAGEREYAESLLRRGVHELLLYDGPRPLIGGDERVVGYLKTVRAQRLPPPALNVVRSLTEGERSPLYLVGPAGSERFEWYVRLRDPGAYAHSLAGSVRLQAYAGANPGARLHQVTRVADWSVSVLPRYATRAHQDPRAPQQLLPVRALESRLRRRLGSAPLLRRRMLVALTNPGGEA